MTDQEQALSFERRWIAAKAKIQGTSNTLPTQKHAMSQGLRDRITTLSASYNAHSNPGRLAELQQAFKEATFIYGTAGLKAVQYGGGGNPAVHVLSNWFYKVQSKRLLGKPDMAGNPRLQPTEPEKIKELTRKLNLYDPGPRIGEYIRRGHQMMDAYFGVGNELHTTRIPIIAEFVHYAMGYSPAFDANTSGQSMWEQTFPGESWGHWPNSLARYGRTPTQEISAIIRRAISEWGGTIVFEGKFVYGANIFDPRQQSRDTDLEAQELFQYFRKGGQTPRVPFGLGFVEFQWGGRPTVPTRAHFLSNWSFANQAVHSIDNQLGANDLGRLFQPGHGLRKIWDNFDDFPVPVPAGQRMAYIEELGRTVMDPHR
ncbi:hypothetical protein HDIA_0624 [Hartmannibacter diazotrophicus]|uniref:Uncharacterized protein n=1 Tax=Hartmannibacter diazotrophicus TaxID=1482074 RepID=A0A2C9D3X3_9HYPH|nr:hypothetical protein [Hartmannibacter diazotrophicus]SON54165.1 hypothetical protein HDIA_0624 [Hartmannibacter diazotrophicus]